MQRNDKDRHIIDPPSPEKTRKRMKTLDTNSRLFARDKLNLLD